METLVLRKIDTPMIDECVDLFIDTFTKEPWNDVYESRAQVVDFFLHHLHNNYFIGYAAILEHRIVAISVGMKKPWINGLEYYIDEFCVSTDMQGKGVGSWFLQEIERDITDLGMNAMILNTEQDFPAHKFYEKNGFKTLKDLIVLAK